MIPKRFGRKKNEIVNSSCPQKCCQVILQIHLLASSQGSFFHIFKNPKRCACLIGILLPCHGRPWTRSCFHCLFSCRLAHLLQKSHASGQKQQKRKPPESQRIQEVQVPSKGSEVARFQVRVASTGSMTVQCSKRAQSVRVLRSQVKVSRHSQVTRKGSKKRIQKVPKFQAKLSERGSGNGRVSEGVVEVFCHNGWTSLEYWW